jgi:predicted  nucleic acid-binding Zn-ribbon protein
MFATRMFECISCGKVWEMPYNEKRPECCPECDRREIKRSLHGILLDRSAMGGYFVQ